MRNPWNAADGKRKKLGARNREIGCYPLTSPKMPPDIVIFYLDQRKQKTGEYKNAEKNKPKRHCHAFHSISIILT